MAIYQLADYLFVCESVTGLGGCGTELLIEQARDTRAAAEEAVAEGWQTFPPSPFDDDRTWSALCGYCGSQRDARIAAARQKRSETNLT